MAHLMLARRKHPNLPALACYVRAGEVCSGAQGETYLVEGRQVSNVDLTRPALYDTSRPDLLWTPCCCTNQTATGL